MKVQVKIPKGWRRVTRGIQQPGDYCISVKEWIRLRLSFGHPITAHYIFIRRIKRKASK